MELISRPRRLRGNSTLRKMVRETRMDKSTLVYPMFVMEGANKKEDPIHGRPVPLQRGPDGGKAAGAP